MVRFGSTFPGVCHHCNSAELKFLRYPRSAEDHMERRMIVLRSCRRCNNTLFKWPTNEITVTVTLPTSLIADATSFAQKHQASLEWCIKPSSADLQLTNLECAARDGFRRRAYLVVGHAAVVDELVFTGHTVCRKLMAKLLPTICGMSEPPTAWRMLDHFVDRIRKPRLQDSDAVGETATKPDSKDGGGGDGPPPDAVYLAKAPPRVVGGSGGGDVPPQDPGEGGAVVRPPEPTAVEALAEAVAATVVEEQQRAYAEGGLLYSTTTAAPGSRPELAEPPGLEGGAASGGRTASARFPLLTTKPNYLHSNNPENLQQAHDLRNVGIGVHNPLVSEALARDRFIDAMKGKVFNATNLRKAMRDFENVRKSALPKKLTHDAAMQAEQDAMNAALTEEGVGYDTVVKAFVKSDVSAKDKPRAIANHGETRLCALAKVAYAFEHVLFDVFRDASIKGRCKRECIEAIMANMSDMRAGARFVENDLTAFEFGISKHLKQIEQELFLHIARLIGVEDISELLFERVVDDRDKCATWKMAFRDATGERKTYKLKIAQTMRESGDRVTSSGNFLQNLVAWFSYLVDPDHVDAAIDSLIRFRGRRMFYASARDKETKVVKGKEVRHNYLACLAFEGDDTAARFEEKIWAEEGEACPVEAFFRRWGWSPKLVWKPLLGDTYLRFVGYEALLHDSKVEYDGGTMVMTPEVGRFLTTKSWTTTDVTPQELKTCIRIYAATLAEGFKHVEPMHAFLQAMYNDQAGGVDVSAEKVREYVLATSGHLPDAGMKISSSVPMPGFECGDPVKWKRLLSVSAGAFTDAEWATMCHVGTVDVHGADLALSVPAAWRA